MLDIDLLMSGDVARLLNISSDRVRQLERAGKLKARRTARGQRIFRASEVDEFLKERLAKSAAAKN